MFYIEWPVLKKVIMGKWVISSPNQRYDLITALFKCFIDWAGFSCERCGARPLVWLMFRLFSLFQTSFDYFVYFTFWCRLHLTSMSTLPSVADYIWLLCLFHPLFQTLFDYCIYFTLCCRLYLTIVLPCPLLHTTFELYYLDLYQTSFEHCVNCSLYHRHPPPINQIGLPPLPENSSGISLLRFA